MKTFEMTKQQQILKDLKNYYVHTITVSGSDFDVTCTIISTRRAAYSSTTNIYSYVGGKIPASGSIKFTSSLGIVNGILFQGANNVVSLSYMNTSGNTYSSTYLATSFHDVTRYLIE